MSKAWIIVLQIGICAVGAAMLASAYYWAQDVAPIYIALYLGGTSLVGFGTLFVRRLRNLEPRNAGTERQFGREASGVSRVR